MAKQKIVPGGELEAITFEEALELAAMFQPPVAKSIRGAEEEVQLDGTGGGAVSAFTVPAGMEFRLSRVVVTADGFTYAAMFTNAAGSVTILRNGNQVIDGFNTSQGIPNAWTANGAASPRFRNGETVQVGFVGGPANGRVTAMVEGELYPGRADG